MSHPITDYEGEYNHPLSGDITITINENGKFDLCWGVLRGTAYPGDEPNEIIVDFRPGSFDALSFRVDEERVISLTFNGVAFIRQ